MASDNKINAELSRSGVYRLNNSSGVLGNSYGAQLEYMNLKTGETCENPIDNVRDISASNSKTNLNASKMSISHEHKESSDYHADESSVTADYDNQRGEEMPQWRKLLLDPEKAGYFLSRQWPRISLRASFRSKEPYIAPNEDNQNSNEKEKIQHRNNCTIYVIIGLAILVILAIIPTIVISVLSKNADSTAGISYVKASMYLTIDSPYKDAYNNSMSPEFDSFENQFCFMIGYVFANGILENYYGCRVTNLTNGSVVVAFVAYFNEATPQRVTKENIEKQLDDYLKKASYSLGIFAVVKNSTQVVDMVIEILTSPPSIRNIKIDATSRTSTPSETRGSFYTRTIPATSVYNLSQALSVFDTYKKNADTSTSIFASDSTPMLKTTEISSFNVFSGISLQLSTFINTQFSKSYVSFSESAMTPVLNTETISKHTTLSDSYVANATGQLNETAFNTIITATSPTALKDYSTFDISKIEQRLSASQQMINSTAFSAESANSFYVSQSATSIASSFVLTSSYTSDIPLSTYATQPVTTSTTSIVPRSSYDSDTGLSSYDSHSTTTGATSFILNNSNDYYSSVSTYGSQSMTTGATASELRISHDFDIAVSTYVFKSMTADGTSFVLKSSQDSNIWESFYVPQFTTTDATSFDLGIRHDSDIRVSSYFSPSTTSGATPCVLSSSHGIAVPNDVTQSMTTGATSLVLKSSQDSNIGLSAYFSQPMSNVETSFVLGRSHNFDIAVSSYVSQSVASVATSLVLNSSDDPNITLSNLIPESKITVTTTDITEGIHNASTADMFTSFLESKAHGITSSFIDIKYTPSSLPISSIPPDIIYSTFLVPRTISDNSPLKISGSESLKVTKSQLKTNESLSINTTEAGNIQISTVDTTSAVPTTTAESTIKQSSQTTAKLMTTQTSKYEIDYFPESDGIYSTIIEIWTYSMPRTEIMSPLQTSYEPPIITSLHLSDLLSSTELSNVLEIIPTETTRRVTWASMSYLSSASMQSTTSVSVLQSTTSVLTTETPIQDFHCANITGELYKGPIIMTCILGTRYDFDRIKIYHGSDNNILFDIELYKNGSKIYLKSDSNITAALDISNVKITFQNVLCHMNGVYYVDLYNSSNFLLKRSFGNLAVTKRPSGTATLQLHADQIADLNFYRSGSEHKCTADIGYPDGKIVVEILMKGAATFSELNVTSNISNSTSNCSILLELKFGIVFTSNMYEAVIRCRIESTVFPTDTPTYSNNETLSLIPACFCENNTGGNFAHPNDCKKYVGCVQKIPHGNSCPSSLCFGVDSVVCDHCQNVICRTTTGPTTKVTIQPTITTATFQGISCNQSISALFLSGPVSILCSINETAKFDFINVTGPSLVDKIATILDDKTVHKIQKNDNIDIRYEQNIIVITLLNISCSDEGVYRLTISFMGNTAFSETTLKVKKRPSGYAVLHLDPDQITDIFRYDKKHTCRADIGYPAGTIVFDILKKGETQFSALNVSADTSKSVTNCTTTISEVNFGALFSSEMNEGLVRCRIENNIFPKDTPVYSNNESLSLIPKNFCENTTAQHPLYPHPTDCTKFVECAGNLPYGKPCLTGLCFGVDSVTCASCSSVNCNKTVTTTESIVQNTLTTERSTG